MTDVQKVKKTKRPLVPRLRFPEFKGKDDWQAPRLGDIAVPVEERAGDRNLTALSISAGAGFVPQSEKFGRNISGGQYRSYTVIHDGDFVYNKGNSIRFPQGCVYDLQGWGEVAVPNVFICFRLNGGCENKFFRQCFEKNIHGIQLRKYITSSVRSNGLLNISKRDFFSIRVPIPIRRERQKIGECLSSLDDLISTEIRKLEVLKKYKRGFLAHIFPKDGHSVPRLRFPGFQNKNIWRRLSLDSVCEINPAKIVITGNPSVSFIPMSAISEEGRVIDSEVRRYSDVRKGYTCFIDRDVLIAKITPCFENGKAALVEGLVGGLGFGSTEFHVFRAYSDRCLPEFLFLQLYRDSVLEAGAISMVGNAGQRRVPVSFFEKLPFFLPVIDEQKVVVKFFRWIDSQIASQRQKIDSLKVQKKGLLQQLFPILNDEEFL